MLYYLETASLSLSRKEAAVVDLKRDGMHTHQASVTDVCGSWSKIEVRLSVLVVVLYYYYCGKKNVIFFEAAEDEDIRQQQPPKPSVFILLSP